MASASCALWRIWLWLWLLAAFLHAFVGAESAKAAHVGEALSSDFFYNIDGAAVSVGEVHACAIEHRDGRQDFGGHVVCWGSDNHGQTTAPDGVFLQVSVGFSHSCAISIDETVKCWGAINNAPKGLFLQISSGVNSVCGVRKDSTLYCWGVNVHGITSPPEGKYVQVTCAKKHCCALNFQGFPVCWGSNRHKQLEPPQGIRFRQISASLSDSTCGVTEAEDVRCWGNRNPKFQHTHHPGRYLQVSVGRAASMCTITADNHTLHCFGSLQSVNKADSTREWAEVVVGYLAMCAVDMYSNLRCWGMGGAVRAPSDIVIA